MTIVESLPDLDLAPLEKQFEQLGKTDASSRRIEIAESLLRAMPQTWRRFESQILSAAAEWEKEKKRLIGAAQEAKEDELSKLKSELSRKKEDIEKSCQLITGHRDSTEREVRQRFSEMWGPIAAVLKKFSPNMIPKINGAHLVAKSVDGATTRWKLEASSWRKNGSLAALVINDVTIVGTPIVMGLLILASCLAIGYHPEPGVWPVVVLLTSLLILSGFIRFCFVTTKKMEAAADLSHQAILEAYSTASSEMRQADADLEVVLDTHSAEVVAHENRARSKASELDSKDNANYRQFGDAILAAVRTVQSMNAAICKVVESERAAPDRITSDLTDGCLASIADKTKIDEQLLIRFATTEYGELPLFSDCTGTNAARLAQSLPNIIYEGLSVPHLWDGNIKKSLLIRDTLPAAEGFSVVAEVIIARLLRQMVPGKLKFTFFDPIGLGRTFASVLRLSDYDETLISSRVWSDRDHIRRRLKDLIEHIEIVIQKYLRNDYEDIEQYNRDAGEIAEAYRFVFVADFPDGFDEESFKDLIRVLQNGPRCGVFAVVHVNESRDDPYGIDADKITPLVLPIDRVGNTQEYRAALNSPVKTETSFAASSNQPIWVDNPPPTSLINEIVDHFGQGVNGAKVVEVPYSKILSSIGADWWSKSTADGISVPLGPAGARKLQFLELGRGTAHHVLIVGRPGSGKSNLIHVFITALARFYPPDELNLYLIDFKKGVEFKAYADWKLPHARVIAIESEREFGFNILEGLNVELTRRGEIFRERSANSLVEYRNKTKQVLPRIVLVIDEFQELFTIDDRLKRDAGQLLDRLVRQGRAFGIHLVLATQSLANAGLDRATQDQMAIRIALQCSETDSRLILAQDNIAARRLSRPGEAIYNDAVGLVEGNKPFQVAFFSDVDRETILSAVAAKASEQGKINEDLVIFEGHDAARLEVSRSVLCALHTKPLPSPVKSLQLWMGEPIALKPTLAVEMKRQAGHNVLVLTRDESEAFGLICAALLSAMAQTTRDQCSFQVLNLGAADAAYGNLLQQLLAADTHDVGLYERRDLKQLLTALAEEVEGRIEGLKDHGPLSLFVIFGLQRVRDLRNRDSYVSVLSDGSQEPELGKLLSKILRDGPEVGVHTLIWCDTFANFDRTLDRGVLRDVAVRLSGPLPAAESQQLFGEPIASLIDRPHRMMKYDDEKVGVFDLFRPFACPVPEMLKSLLEIMLDRDIQPE